MATNEIFLEREVPVLQPLRLSQPEEPCPGSTPTKSLKEDIMCLFCEEKYDCILNKNDYLKHLLEKHKFVIADVKIITDFKRYVEYWRRRFTENSITEFCSVINTNTDEEDVGPKEQYYLLCDALPEDKRLRQQLQQEKLAEVLEQHQRERNDESFTRLCLFCKEQFQKVRAALFNHMASEHNFNVGQPDNLVYTDEFLDLLEEKLNLLQCLYCEKTFKDRFTLKEHMRKKQHKKINSKNTVYDKFYLVNYLELGKNWEVLEGELDEPDDRESDAGDDWSDWREEGGAQAVCLFCDTQATTSDLLMEHMKSTHGFDLIALRESLKLNFYLQVKLVNYIRRQVYQNTCLFCDVKYKSREDLMEHLEKSGHISKIPDVTVWDQPQYFFPTYENDNLLFELSDREDDTGQDSVVIAEDNPVTESILTDSVIRREILNS